MHPTRRHLLATTSLAAAGLTSGWLSQAFAGEGSGISAEDLMYAWKQARSKGRPLLVLIVPADRSKSHAYGTAWGSVLNHGSNDNRAALQLCELCCADYSVVRATFGGELEERDAPLPKVEPLGLLLETDALSATAIVPPRGLGELRGPTSHKNRDSIAESNCQEIGEDLRQAIAPSPEAIRRRAEQEQKALPLDTSRFSYETQATLSPASFYATPWEGRSDLRRQARAILAAQFDKRMKNRVQGAEWGLDTMCGFRLEHEPDVVLISCGMGSVPHISRRFLYFLEAKPS